MRDPKENNTSARGGRALIIIPSLLLLAVVILGGAIWTYSTRDWNASSTQKAGSPTGNTPSEGGRPLILNK
jgi:hypothetical protein